MRKTDNLIRISIYLSIAGILFIIWYFFYSNFWTLITKNDFSTLGQLGDLIGGFIGTIFALIATILLIATLNTQRESNKKTKLFLYNQQFENSFISLLNALNEHIKTIEYNIGKREVVGKKYFQHCHNTITRYFDANINRNDRLNKVISTYEVFYLKNRNYLGSYYRLLYRIFDLIDDSDLTENRKFHYAKILRATLSESELFLLHYNSLTEQGKNFRILIVKYNILKHLPLSSHIELKEFFEKLCPAEFANFKYITDEIGMLTKRTISETLHLELPIKFTDLKLNSFNLRNGIRLDVTIPKNKKYPETFYEKLNNDNKFNYIQDVLWEICIFSNYGSLLTSLESIKYNSEILNNNTETTYRFEMDFPLETKLKILEDKI